MGAVGQLGTSSPNWQALLSKRSMSVIHGEEIHTRELGYNNSPINKDWSKSDGRSDDRCEYMSLDDDKD